MTTEQQIQAQIRLDLLKLIYQNVSTAEVAVKELAKLEAVVMPGETSDMARVTIAAENPQAPTKQCRCESCRQNPGAGHWPPIDSGCKCGGDRCALETLTQKPSYTVQQCDDPECFICRHSAGHFVIVR